jgi:hypothetical protein
LRHIFSSLFEKDTLFCGYRLNFLVKGCELIPKLRLTAADTGMACLHRPTGTVVEFGNRAVVIGFRTSAAHFVEAIPHGRFFGTELFDKLIVLEVGSSGALIVNGLSICK